MAKTCDHRARLSSAEEDRCIEITDEFQCAWEVREDPGLEAWLLASDETEPGAGLRLAALIDMARADLEFMLDDGHPVDIHERYVRRYPELETCRSCLLDLHGLAFDRLRARDPRFTVADYLRAVPEEFHDAIRLRLDPLARYVFQGEIGRGTTGTVFKAQDVETGRTVAIKRISSDAPLELHERFRTEAKAVARLVHENIIRLYHDIRTDERVTYLVLEYADGGNLEEKLGREPLGPREAAEVIQALALAVNYAHKAGVVHRDLKPSNVVLTTDGVPKITDFGLARLLDDPRLTKSGCLVGSPAYMAPEQAGLQHEKVGPAADLYALGAILYRILDGAPPFEATTSGEMIQKVREEEPAPLRPRNPKLPRDLETICLHCLEKDPARRYPDGRELAEDLGRFLADLPVKARPVSRSERAVRWARRHPAVASLLGTLAVVILGWVLSLLAANRGLTTALANAENSLQVALGIAADGASRAEALLPLAGVQEGTVRAMLDDTRAGFDRAAAKAGAGRREVRVGRAKIALAYSDAWLASDASERAVDEADRAYRLFEELDAAGPGLAEAGLGKATARTKRGVALYAKGDLAGSWAAHSEALVLREQDLRRFPGAPDAGRRKADLAATHLHLGHILWTKGDRHAARKRFETSLSLAEAAFALNRTDERTMYELARSLMGMGDSESSPGAKAARVSYERGLALTQRLVGETEQADALQSKKYGWLHTGLLLQLGNHLQFSDDPGKARAFFERALRLSEKITRLNPENLAWQLRTLRFRYACADLDDVRSRRDALRELDDVLTSALSQLNELSAGKAAKAEAQSLKAFFLSRLAMLQVARRDESARSEDSRRARETLDHAVEIQRRLAARHPDDLGYLRDLDSYVYSLYTLSLSAGPGSARPAEAGDPLLEFYRLRSKEDPTNLSWLEGVADRLGESSNNGFMESGVDPSNARESLEIYDRLLRLQPRSEAWLNGLVKTLTTIRLQSGSLPEKTRACRQEAEAREQLVALDGTDRRRWYGLEDAYKRLAEALSASGDGPASEAAIDKAMACRPRMLAALPDEVTRDPFAVRGEGSLTAGCLKQPLKDQMNNGYLVVFRAILQLNAIGKSTLRRSGRLFNVKLADSVTNAIRARAQLFPYDPVRVFQFRRVGLRVLHGLRAEGKLLPEQEHLIASLARSLRDRRSPPVWDKLSPQDRELLERMDYRGMFSRLRDRKDHRTALELLDAEVGGASRLGKDEFEFTRGFVLTDLITDPSLREFLRESVDSMGPVDALFTHGLAGREALSCLLFLSGDWHRADLVALPGTRSLPNDFEDSFLKSFVVVQYRENPVKALRPEEISIPIFLDYWHVLGLCDRGDVEAAERTYAETIEPLGDTMPTPLIRARMLLERHRFAQARSLIEESMAANRGKYDEVFRLFGDVLHARTLIGLGEAKRAVEELDAVLRDNPSYIQARIYRIQALSEARVARPADIRFAADLVERNPSDVELKIIHANQLRRLGVARASLSLLEPLQSDPAAARRPELFLELGTAYEFLDKRAQALAAYERGLKALPPDCPDEDPVKREMASRIADLRKGAGAG